MNAAIGEMINEIETASRGAEVRSPIADVLNELNAHALPDVSAADEGKILVVDANGAWSIGEAGGGGGDMDALIARTLTEVSSDTCKSVGANAFYNYTTLQGVHLPAAESIGRYAFRGCSSLTSVVFTSARSIGMGTFSSCTSLASASFPAVESIGEEAFLGCSSLTSVVFASADIIGNSAFERCTKLVDVSFPSATYIVSEAFYSCSKLSSVSFPSALATDSSAFRYCSGLVEIPSQSFPVLATIGAGTFADCTSLASASFPAATEIGYGAFSGCASLASVTLASPTLCVLDSATAFSGTAAELKIYVPADLVDTYKANTIWSAYASKIEAIP